VGNLIEKSKGAGLETWYYSYNQANQLLSVRKTSDGTTNTLTVTYAYDAFGNRVKEDEWTSGTGVVTTKSVYVDGQDYLDLTSGNAVQERYIRGDSANELIARIDGSGNEAWYLTDRLGSVRDIINNSGTDLDSVTYSAWGQITTQTNSTNLGNFAWQGMQYDANTVLYGPRFRPTYDPLTGRYGNIDPTLIQGGSPNFYIDVGNNPTNATDPSGLRPTSFHWVNPATWIDEQQRIVADLESRRPGLSGLEWTTIGGPADFMIFPIGNPTTVWTFEAFRLSWDQPGLAVTDAVNAAVWLLTHHSRVFTNTTAIPPVIATNVQHGSGIVAAWFLNQPPYSVWTSRGWIEYEVQPDGLIPYWYRKDRRGRPFQPIPRLSWYAELAPIIGGLYMVLEPFGSILEPFWRLPWIKSAPLPHIPPFAPPTPAAIPFRNAPPWQAPPPRKWRWPTPLIS
jgi:RHS repeat-associated protein